MAKIIKQIIHFLFCIVTLGHLGGEWAPGAIFIFNDYFLKLLMSRTNAEELGVWLPLPFQKSLFKGTLVKIKYGSFTKITSLIHWIVSKIGGQLKYQTFSNFIS